MVQFNLPAAGKFRQKYILKYETLVYYSNPRMGRSKQRHHPRTVQRACMHHRAGRASSEHRNCRYFSGLIPTGRGVRFYLSVFETRRHTAAGNNQPAIVRIPVADYPHIQLSFRLGVSAAELARGYKCSIATIYRIVKKKYTP